MASIIENLNEVISTKNEIKGILRDNGIDPGDVFSDYPNMIRSIVGGGSVSGDTVNSYISAYLDSYNFIDQNELSANSYVTSDVLSAQSYITSSDLPAIDENIIPKETGTYTLGDSSHRYIDTYSYNYRFGYITYLASDNDYDIHLSVNGRNKVQWNLYQYFFVDDNYRAQSSLGINSRPWGNTYTTNLYSGNIVLSDTYNFITNVSNTQINFAVNQYNRFKMTNAAFAPSSNNSVNLGTSSELFKNAYTTNIYTENVLYTSGKSSIKMNDRNVDIWANNKKMVNVSDYNGVVPTQTNVNLGDSSNKWSATYTSNLYADTAYSTRYNFTYNTWVGSDSDYEFHIGVNNQKRFQMNMYQFYAVTNPDNSSLGVPNYPWAYTYTSNIYADNAYISNIHNFIWTGTSAEYAALSNYTTYQIYLIQEA